MLVQQCLMEHWMFWYDGMNQRRELLIRNMKSGKLRSWDQSCTCDILGSGNSPQSSPIQPWSGGSGTGRPSQASSADFHLGQGAAHLLHLLHLNRNCWPRKSGSKVARAELELALSLSLHQGLLWHIKSLGLERYKFGWGSWLYTV